MTFKFKLKTKDRYQLQYMIPVYKAYLSGYRIVDPEDFDTMDTSRGVGQEIYEEETEYDTRVALGKEVEKGRDNIEYFLDDVYDDEYFDGYGAYKMEYLAHVFPSFNFDYEGEFIGAEIGHTVYEKASLKGGIFTFTSLIEDILPSLTNTDYYKEDENYSSSREFYSLTKKFDGTVWREKQYSTKEKFIAFYSEKQNKYENRLIKITASQIFTPSDFPNFDEIFKDIDADDSIDFSVSDEPYTLDISFPNIYKSLKTSQGIKDRLTKIFNSKDMAPPKSLDITNVKVKKKRDAIDEKYIRIQFDIEGVY